MIISSQRYNIPQSTTRLANYTRDIQNTTGLHHNESFERTKHINQKSTPFLITWTLAGLRINEGKYSLMSVKTPRVGPGDNRGLVDQTDVLFHVDKDVAITTRLSSFFRSSERGSTRHPSKRPRRRPTKRTPRQNLT